MSKVKNTMIHSSVIALAIGLSTSLFVPGIAAAAIWSVKADCKAADWTVRVQLAGFGSIDASCVDGRETRAIVDVGDLLVTGGSIEATSSAGAICDLPSGHGSKFSVECESESDDPAALEPKAEVEVEVELEEHEEEEEEVEVD